MLWGLVHARSTRTEWHGTIAEGRAKAQSPGGVTTSGVSAAMELHLIAFSCTKGEGVKMSVNEKHEKTVASTSAEQLTCI